MMSKFLLLFCFTTLYVLAEGQGNIVLVKNDPVSAAVSPQKDNAAQNSEEHLTDKALKPEGAVLTPSVHNDKTSSEDAIETTSSSIEPWPSTAKTPEPAHPKPTPPTTTTSTTTTSTTTTTTTTPQPPPPETTTPSTTTTSTTAPTTSTTVSPVVPTTPLPPQNPGKWIVNEANITCIVVQISVQFNITYPKANKTVSHIMFDMPMDNATTIASGNCGKLEQVLTLTWSPKNAPIGNMSLHFTKNESTNHYSLHHLEVVLPVTDFLNTTLNQSMVLIHEPTNYAAGLTNSYRCLKKQTLNLKMNGTNADSGFITVSGLQFEAFKTNNSTNFGLAKDCAFDTPDVVPIAVGCALAGLVIIVLIAYLIGRKRNHAQGYLSM